MIDDTSSEDDSEVNNLNEFIENHSCVDILKVINSFKNKDYQYMTRSVMLLDMNMYVKFNEKFHFLNYEMEYDINKYHFAFKDAN